ncbi:integrator complex subunit 15-like [Ciona intestinalis]
MNQRQYTSSVQEVLQKLENIFKNQSGSSFSKDSTIARVDNVIFKCSVDWISQQKVLTPVEELELIDELCMYLQQQKHEYVRYRVFEALFSMARESAQMYRREVLCKLVSLGIAAKASAVLECAALWMKSCDKSHAIHLVMSLIEDYCTLQKNGTIELKSCLEVSPRFCCVFTIALTSNYNMMARDRAQTKSQRFPELQVLDVVQHWLLTEPTLCFSTATQMDKLWRTVIKATQTLPDSLSLTPLDGLIQWSVKLPFSDEGSQNKMEISTEDGVSYYTLHSKLHYALLKALLASKPALKAIAKGSVLGNPDLQLWGKPQVHSLIGDLMTLCPDSDKPKAGSPTELSINRFSQICQVGMTMRVLNCTKDQFQSLSDPLPKTRLLELVAYGSARRSSVDEVPMDIAQSY